MKRLCQRAHLQYLKKITVLVSLIRKYLEQYGEGKLRQSK